MNIAELTIKQDNVEVEGTILNIGETRSFNKFGKQLTVANAMLQDESGSIKLTLWNDDVTRFKDGDKIKIKNGFVGEFQGEKQLTSGKFGSIEKLESDK
ncbi:DNA-binding protein [Candidatus Pacearchaeota archaeon]|nr:DNA-binding protein [Candidatus Pacearchaeota archaeon]